MEARGGDGRAGSALAAQAQQRFRLGGLVEELRLETASGLIEVDGTVEPTGRLWARSHNGPIRLLSNQVGQEQPWLGLRLTGGKKERDMLGTRVEVKRSGAG